MAKRKKNRAKWVAAVLIVLLILSAGAVWFLQSRYGGKENPESEGSPLSSNQPPLPSADAVIPVASGKAFNTNTESGIVEISVNGDIAKIDCISPGLDTSSMDIVMFDLKADKELSRTALAEDYWITGQTNDGFYTISASEKMLRQYDTAGKMVSSKALPFEPCSPVCCLSPDGQYLLYTNQKDGKLSLFNVSSDADTGLDLVAFEMDLCGYENGKFFLSSQRRTLTSISAADGKKSVLFSDPKLSYVFADCGVGTTETCFFARSGKDSGSVTYTPIQSVDERVSATWENGFITASSGQNNDIVRCYDLNKKVVRSLPVGGTVIDVCVAANDRLLAVVRDENKGTYSLYTLYPERGEKSAITVSDKDVIGAEQGADKDTSSVQEAKPGATAKILSDVPVISQFPKYPTGCETVSAVMVLRHAGEKISVDEFIDKHLPMSSNFYLEGGRRYGPDPSEYFIGSPRSAASFGCMAPTMEKALTSYFGSDSRVKNTTGLDLDTLCSQYIDREMPVMVWATIRMLDTQPLNSWYLSDGTRFTWPGNEHCIVLVGYDEQNYYFNDPYEGKLVKYDKQTANDHYSEMGMQSIVVTEG